MNGTHVGLFLPSLRGGGAERSMVTLANAMAAAGVRTDLLLVQARGPYLAEVSAAVRVVDLGASRVMGSLTSLARYLRREKPAGLIATPSHANVVAIWSNLLAGRPTRVIVREANAIGRAGSDPFESRWMPRFIRWFYPWADHVVAVSEGVARDLASTIRVPLASISVIYNPILTPDLEYRAREVPDHPWFSTPGLSVLLAVGRLSAQKDFPTLLRAFSKLRHQNALRLVILGEGDDRSRLQSMIRDMDLEDRVALPGFVGNPFSYMSRARLFVLSSAWEGLPGVLLQAMACGCPVVSTDCPSGPAEILENGRWGRLVPVGDAQALASAIEQTLADRQAPDVRRRAADFGVGQAVDAYLALVGANATAHGEQPE
jgi:glycosyltransferase involved in cell wall biosynthesis